MHPISYLTLYFLESAVTQNFTAILNFAILTTAIAYPFILLGKKIYKKFNKQKPFSSLLTTTAISFIIAWVCINIYNLIMGNRIAFNLIGIILGIIFVFIFVLIGKKIKELINSKYTIPEKLNLLIIDLITSIIAWVIIFGLFYLNYGVISWKK